MRRGLDKAETYALVEKMRREVPGIALRTTLLTGYPGESEQDFEELLQFVRDIRFERLGVFPYSEEEGTYSATKLQDDVPEEVKQQRVDRIMELQNEISRENNLRRVGRTERVILDRREGDYWIGRTPVRFARSRYRNTDLSLRNREIRPRKYRRQDSLRWTVPRCQDHPSG